MDILLYAGAAFGIILGVSILPSKGRGAEEKWMMGSLLIIGALATASITFQHRMSPFDRGGLLELFEIGPGFAMGPVLFLFCRWRTGRTIPGRLIAAHFIPAVMVTLLILLQGRYILPISLMVAHQMTYTFISLRVVLAARKVDRNDSWPLRLCSFAIAIHVAQIIRMSFTDVHVLRNIVPLVMMGGFATLSLLALRQLLDSSFARGIRYERSGLDDEAAALLEERLARAMRVDRLWLDPQLSLDRLAGRVGSSAHHVSELLNTRIGTSFHEFVANERLEEAKRRLADPANDVYTIEAIAEGSGFPSRSSFYAAFRRRFGMTPTQFRRRARGGKA